MTKRQKKSNHTATKAIAEKGALTIKPSEDGSSVMMEVHYCTVFLEKKDVLLVLLAMLKAARKVWPGDVFDDINVR